MSAKKLRNTSISIIIPAFNEEDNIRKAVRESLSVLAWVSQKYEVLVVNDGSTDRTGKILDELQARNPHMRVIHHPRNLGTGHALRTLYRNARGNLIFLIPADLQVRADQLPKFIQSLRSFDVVFGRRAKRADSWLRKFLAWAYNTALRVLFKTDIQDMDTAKLYQRKVLRSFPIESTSGFIEAEILIKAKKQGFKIGEIHIQHHPRLAGTQTGIKLKVILRALKELIRFYFKLRFYQPPKKSRVD